MSARPLHAALWMMGAVGGFSSMAIAGRQLGGQLDTFEIMAYRSVIGFGIVLALGWATGALRSVNSAHLQLHFWRNVFHFTGQNLWFFAVAIIPLAQVIALEFTAPILVVLLAPMVLGDRLTRLNVITALIGFCGILIVARPFGAGALSPGLIAAALCAWGFAGSILFTRKLTQKGDVTVTCVLFWLTLMQMVFGFACAGLDGDMTLPSLPTAGWLVVVGMGGLVAHFCLTTALSLAPPAIVSPIDFVRLPLIALLGAAIYGEALEWPVLLGAAIIFGANYANILGLGGRGTAKSA
ncbi:DMT family transporter [Aliiroseovarius sp. PTFE2010]|uniref:DMT family transporter n=1 Tax=Aliiroseovarius sp. PTFE2010 TaxID=3417190 RepID=UPI003CED72F9